MMRLADKLPVFAFIALVVSILSLSSVTYGGFAAQALGKAGDDGAVADWFKKYDQIRREAQMSDSEKERSRRLMTQGLAANFLQSEQSAQDKAAANALLTKMVERYRRALGQIRALPAVSQTKKLQLGYAQYFCSAGDLFADYLKVQNNLFATDSNGNPILGQLQQRKADLESLDAANKDLDGRLRQKFQIAAYRY